MTMRSRLAPLAPPGAKNTAVGHAKACASFCGSVRGKERRVELLVYLCDLLAGAAARAEFRDRLEVVILSTRQAPVEHARRRVADVLEPVHHVARDEDDGAGAGRRGLIPDGQLIGALDDEEYLFLAAAPGRGRTPRRRPERRPAPPGRYAARP